jgi:hypothetical protein|tara:strand:- start:1922 stop:2248 length:327 start_codon:yes stop_codon:yes gene_type:complete
MWICKTSKFCFGDKGMSSESKKGETEKTIILGWRLVVDLLAYIYYALCDGVISIMKLHSSSKLSHSAEICDHKVEDIVQAESYYGPEDNQYTTYWYCEECGEEMPSEE